MIMNSINTHKHLMLRFILICVIISCCYFNVVEMKICKPPGVTLNGLRYSR
uniref:Hypotheticial protein n=1 Tax=Schistosoma japonicum TaxID=6182 RepID=C1LA71_SCHJA|nr:hypotheticial protein [Schistosoma japonicum]